MERTSKKSDYSVPIYNVFTSNFILKTLKHKICEDPKNGVQINFTVNLGLFEIINKSNDLLRETIHLD